MSSALIHTFVHVLDKVLVPCMHFSVPGSQDGRPAVVAVFFAFVCLWKCGNLDPTGWGHGFFHLMLVPYLHFLMRGAKLGSFKVYQLDNRCVYRMFVYQNLYHKGLAFSCSLSWSVFTCLPGAAS